MLDLHEPGRTESLSDDNVSWLNARKYEMGTADVETAMRWLIDYVKKTENP